jgi:cell division protein FtsI/penicillin-binding protein 2
MRQQEPNSERRIRWIARIAVVWVIVLLLRMGDLQIRQHEEIKKRAEKQQERPVTLRGVRGAITDENGQPLAISVPTDTIYVSPKRLEAVTNIDTASLVLATGLKMNPSQVRKLILSAEDKKPIRIARQVPRRQSSNLCGLSHAPGFDYMWCEEEEVREHPAGNLAAHVLGPVGRDHNGLYGLERSLQSELAGKRGKSRVVTDSARHAYQEEVQQKAELGTTIKLTLNSDIQYAAEQALMRAMQRHNAPRGTVIVMDPKTGAVLAMASYPTFELGKPPGSANDPALQNLAVKHAFEPGSVFKMITMTAAIETTDLRPESRIDCGSGAITIGKFKIRDVHGGGVRTMEEVFASSMNTGSIRIGQRVGAENLRRYINEFGFGTMTGVELPEARGFVQPGMADITRASQSIGYAVDVTSLQLARAASVFANGGLLVKPYLVASRKFADGREEVYKPQPGRRIIKPETAITMRRMMEAVMLKGTGRKTAKLDGYTSGGKTGTARYYDPTARKYINGKFNASFAGMAPLNDPRIVVVVNLFGTHGENVGFGGATAGPVFREVAHAALRILGVPPDPKLMKDSPENVQSETSEIADSGVPATIAVPQHNNEFSLASVPNPLAPPDSKGPSQRSFSKPKVRQRKTEP